jgi:hypothetical protein
MWKPYRYVWSLGGDLNTGPLDYETGMLISWQRSLIWIDGFVYAVHGRQNKWGTQTFKDAAGKHVSSIGSFIVRAEFHVPSFSEF